MDLSQSQVATLISTLSHGTDDDLWGILYGSGGLSRDQLAAPLRLLGQFRSPTMDQTIEVLDAGYQEPFWMLILSVPWLKNGSYRPLLICHDQGVPKLAGLVLPWNEIIPTFNELQMSNANRLAVWWTIKLKELTARK